MSVIEHTTVALETYYLIQILLVIRIPTPVAGSRYCSSSLEAHRNRMYLPIPARMCNLSRLEKKILVTCPLISTSLIDSLAQRCR